MRTLRVIATIVTGTTMLAGGAMLSMNGPPLVVALGITTALIGGAYTIAGLTAERTPRPHHETGATASPPPVRKTVTDDYLGSLFQHAMNTSESSTNPPSSIQRQTATARDEA